MKKFLFTSALAVVVPMILAGTAMAQSSNIDSSAASQSVNNTQVIVGGGGSPGTQKVEYSGSYSVKSNPDVVPPMLPGGANPCVVGASAGGSVVGFGVSGGASWNDVDCERRNLSIVFLNAAKQFEDPSLAVVGIEILCNNREVADAMRLAGRPCLSDRVQPQITNASVGRNQTASATNGNDDFDWIAAAGN